MTRIMVVDDHPLVLAGIRAALNETPFQVVATASDGADALDRIAASDAEAVILDVLMPRRSGLDVLRVLRLRGDRRPVVLLTSGINDAALLEALDLGVQGIVTKDGAAEMLPICLRHVMLGGQWIEPALLQRALASARRGTPTDDRRAMMTPRERTMAELVTRGLRNCDIAAELGVTEAMVKVTIHRLYDRLGLQNRVELALLMREDSFDSHNPPALAKLSKLPSEPGCSEINVPA